MQIQLPGATAGGAGAEYQSRADSKPRLIHAAHEFEGQMLKELLKPLTATDGLTGDEPEDSSKGVLGEFASEALGKALSERGGFGIADRILNDFSRSGNHSATEAVTRNVHFDTGMREIKSLE
jgi:Rod binding domain-containing protein